MFEIDENERVFLNQTFPTALRLGKQKDSRCTSMQPHRTLHIDARKYALQPNLFMQFVLENVGTYRSRGTISVCISPHEVSNRAPASLRSGRTCELVPGTLIGGSPDRRMAAVKMSLLFGTCLASTVRPRCTTAGIRFATASTSLL